MFLRDFHCCACGTITEDVITESAAVLDLVLDCKTCGAATLHRYVNNGGTKKRYRYLDLPTDPEFYRGQVKVTPCEAHDSFGEPVRHYTSGTREIGGPVHDDERFQDGSDKREAKRDELKHETRRKRGRLPIVVDLGKQSS